MKTLAASVTAIFAVIASFIYLGQPAIAGEFGAAKKAEAGERHDYTVVNAEELQAMLENPEVIVFDSRGGKYLKGDIIKGAKPLSVKDTNAETLAEIVPSKDTPLVFYCTNTGCPASKYGALRAKDAGYNNLYKFPGGIDEWKEKGLPVEKI